MAEPETVTLRPSALVHSRDGTVAFGVQTMQTDPPRMMLMATADGTDLQPRWLSLGDTTTLGGTTWRFEDVRFHGPHAWVATVRSVPAGAATFTPPPPTGDRVRTPEEPAGAVPTGEPDLVGLVGEAVDFAGRATASMRAEFDVRYVSEVAMLARLGRIARSGRCADGLRYDIHGNGYDVHLDGSVALTVQGHGYAPVGRPAGPDDGLYDYVDVYALRDFLDDRTGIRVDLDRLGAACEEYCRRGLLRATGDRRYELLGPPALPPVPGGVEEAQ